MASVVSPRASLALSLGPASTEWLLSEAHTGNAGVWVLSPQRPRPTGGSQCLSQNSQQRVLLLSPVMNRGFGSTESTDSTVDSTNSTVSESTVGARRMRLVTGFAQCRVSCPCPIPAHGPKLQKQWPVKGNKSYWKTQNHACRGCETFRDRKNFCMLRISCVLLV